MAPTLLEEVKLNVDTFFAELKRHHNERGTVVTVPFAPGSTWQVGTKRVNPHRLFVEVVDRGGYHQASRDKRNWWAVAKALGIPEGLVGTLAFQVKVLYGTWLESFEKAMQGPAMVDAGSGDSRSTRGLRRAPPQRQPAFPEPPTTRQTRSGANTSTSPHPPGSSSNLPTNASPNLNTPLFNISNFEGRPPPKPMYTIEVDTPGNRRGKFSQHGDTPETLPRHVDPMLISMVPEKTPRIYNHCVRGLECGIPNEVDFALHHLVVISDERGDKFKFSDFPMLAESLIEKVLEVTFLVSGVNWELDYDFPREVPKAPNVLNAAYGTPDILDRINRLPITLPNDDVEDDQFFHHLRHIKEAALILRNMTMMEENAVFLHDMEILKDCMVVVLNLPRQSRFNEIRNNILDMIEQVCPYWTTSPTDPLFTSLIGCLDSHDRYHNLTALKALILYSMELEENKRLEGIPKSKVEILMNFSLLEQDKELLSGTLDFFYQYTALPENVEELLGHFHMPTTLIPRLVNLLLFEGEQQKVVKVDQEERKAPPATKIPVAPPDLYVALMQMTEPERCSRWLKCCFVEDEECEITQLALWHAYQNCFAEGKIHGIQGAPTLAAAEFINTVSKTFSAAQAQVVNGAVARFIIKGIRPLETPYNLEGHPFLYCKWHIAPYGICNHVYVEPAMLRDHVYQEHLHLDSKSPGGWNLQEADRPIHACRWDGCEAYTIPVVNTALVAGHVSTHLPPLRDMSQPPPIPPRPIIQPRITRVFDYYPTPVDEKGEPVGIAYKAILILRNITRNLPKESAGPKHGNLSWNHVVFFSQRKKIVEIADLNPTLRADIFDLANEIKSS